MTPVHPGRILRRELEARGLSANRLALALRVPSGRITGILNANRGIIPKVLNIDPFHRGYFRRQSGVRCAAVRAPQATRDAAGDQKRPALRVGHIGPPGALRRLPDVPHRAARRACPADRCAP